MHLISAYLSVAVELSFLIVFVFDRLACFFLALLPELRLEFVHIQIGRLASLRLDIFGVKSDVLVNCLLGQIVVVFDFVVRIAYYLPSVVYVQHLFFVFQQVLLSLH